MFTNTNWTIDENASHIAHSSGLYAYFSANPTSCGGILCVGPFSSYSQRLTKSEVYSYTFDAIQALEERIDHRTYYTIWGTYSQRQSDDSCEGRKINILGDNFDFIANPSFRTSALLTHVRRQGDAQTNLLREWRWSKEKNEISHRIGLCFSFSRSSKNRLHCDVSIEQHTADLGLLGKKIKPLLLRSLSTTAFAVLNKISENTLQPAQEPLSISVPNELLVS